MNEEKIVFSRPFRADSEARNLEAVLASGHAHGDGPFTASATARLEQITGSERVLLTTSCTHALEMTSMLLDLAPGDEVILPSYTFPSAATAVSAYGATSVFVDVVKDTGVIDAELIESAITSRTKAISVMHYGGVAPDMHRVLEIAHAHGLPVIEDNAHGLGGEWDGQKLGTFGAFATQSFHSTKNVHSGEGGALLINDDRFVERAEIIREKGTNRSRFLRGQVDKYSWVDKGSSYLPSEFNAAVLDAQLEQFDHIQRLRGGVWERYSRELAEWAARSAVLPMTIPAKATQIAHLFYLLMPSFEMQQALLEHLRDRGVIGTFHYIPLDSSVAGRRFGRTPQECRNSLDFSRRIVRLPLWAGMSDSQVDRVIDAVRAFTVTGTA
ncbi:dTDP-4-amino-4,6-dideoxygalactose transaminase [Mycetocola spongiae]|uniref:dTDP-4-amino-4,6-dideoxygalactose transaminase n=1 Tax=Mycetocola spongiae TaxID=2859226 RepID=UPI001CF45539|nr:dTDP-4-amino-4,6-dideoxygalactose transaminase [Mycetocola spongiae]UCR89701.1 dTDP-4-amino-4,6-dideoxygalactose transaminase [Mycetocola spongiae]